MEVRSLVSYLQVLGALLQAGFCNLMSSIGCSPSLAAPESRHFPTLNLRP